MDSPTQKIKSQTKEVLEHRSEHRFGNDWIWSMTNGQTERKLTYDDNGDIFLLKRVCLVTCND